MCSVLTGALQGPVRDRWAERSERKRAADGRVMGLGESLSPWLIVVPLSTRPVDGVRKEKERLTAGPHGAHRGP